MVCWKKWCWWSQRRRKILQLLRKLSGISVAVFVRGWWLSGQIGRMMMIQRRKMNQKRMMILIQMFAVQQQQMSLFEK